MLYSSLFLVKHNHVCSVFSFFLSIFIIASHDPDNFVVSKGRLKPFQLLIVVLS